MASDPLAGHETAEPPEAAEAAPRDPALAIGARLAEHRNRRGVKVSALARQIGVSPSLISQIERGQSRPSVSTLFALAEALNVAVDAFFRDGEVAPGLPRPMVEAPARDGQRQDRYAVRSHERARIDIEGGVRWERLTPAPLGDVEFMELIYAPGAESNPALYRHPGFEMVLVLSGRLTIFVGFERYDLAAGDSMAFPSTLPHRYLNPGEEETRAVTTILRDGLPQSSSAATGESGSHSA
ncbi:MAG TPA: XRE family transcriptional regulator [Solirubrobacteraceae bacterium]|nr:XRE family transcriptional regulator [Solirubrobacteraceae bacterium]